jgi:hypothetical protein
VDKYGRAREATNDNVTIVSRTRPSVTFMRTLPVLFKSVPENGCGC